MDHNALTHEAGRGGAGRGRGGGAAVAGGSNTGKSTLVNLLLDSPADKPYIPQGLAKDRARVYRIRYAAASAHTPAHTGEIRSALMQDGELRCGGAACRYSATPCTAAESADPTADVVQVEASAPWLQRLEAWGGLEITDTPGYGAWVSGQAAIDAALDAADEVVLVTDCSRQLTDTTEVNLLRRLADKRPVVVLNQIDRVLPAPSAAALPTAAPAPAPASPASPVGSTQLAQIVGRVKASLDAALLYRADDGLVLGERTPVFAVSGKRYARREKGGRVGK